MDGHNTSGLGHPQGHPSVVNPNVLGASPGFRDESFCSQMYSLHVRVPVTGVSPVFFL